MSFVSHRPRISVGYNRRSWREDGGCVHMRLRCDNHLRPRQPPTFRKHHPPRACHLSRQNMILKGRRTLRCNHENGKLYTKLAGRTKRIGSLQVTTVAHGVRMAVVFTRVSAAKILAHDCLQPSGQITRLRRDGTHSRPKMNVKEVRTLRCDHRIGKLYTFDR